MLQSGNIIRMNDTEAENFRAMTGRPEIPKTRAEYNRMLAVAEAEWRDIGTPEGDFMATLAHDLLLADN